MKTHPQRWAFEMGHTDEDGITELFWIHGDVRARTAIKAKRKARRIQKKTGWPLMRVEVAGSWSPAIHFARPEVPR